MATFNNTHSNEEKTEVKFAGFDRTIAEAKRQGISTVLVASPQTLGDTYEELIRNLAKLQEAQLSLLIASRSV